MSRLQQIEDKLRESAELEGEEFKSKCLKNEDVDWLVEQAHKLENLIKNILGDGK